MEPYIKISYLNDFIFCPKSIYFHELYGEISTRLYQEKSQIEGKAIHKALDEKTYSTKKSILQGINIYSEKYKLCGKLDKFDLETKTLTERKKKVKVLYDGYVLQLYAEYYCLTEMGYDVKKLCIYSYDDNKNYPIELPDDNIKMKNLFLKVLKDISNLKIEDFTQDNQEKCNRCIYNPMCDQSLC